MNNKNIDIVVIGNIVKETIFYNDKTEGPVLGSPCAYTSLALAKAGMRVGIVTHCGEDMKDLLEKELRLVDKEGCISYLYTTENHLICNEHGENQVEYFKAAPMINFEKIPETYMDAKIYFICPMDFDVNVDICEKLKKRGKKIIVDLGGYGGTTSYNHFSIATKRGKKLIEDLCKNAFIVKASQDDLKYIMPELSVEECLKYIVQRGPEFAVATMGDSGAAYCNREGIFEVCQAVEIGDKVKKNLVGAGDVFSAGLIIAIQEGEKIRDSVIHANSMASLVLEEKGGCIESRMPFYQMVKLRMEGKV